MASSGMPGPLSVSETETTFSSGISSTLIFDRVHSVDKDVQEDLPHLFGIGHDVRAIGDLASDLESPFSEAFIEKRQHIADGIGDVE